MARDWAKWFYNSIEWKQMRNYILRRDNFICQCHKLTNNEPCFETADDVHHIIWLTPNNVMDVSITLNEKNLISMSRLHHSKIHELKRINNSKLAVKSDAVGEGFSFDKDGNLIQLPPIPSTVITQGRPSKWG